MLLLFSHFPAPPPLTCILCSCEEDYYLQCNLWPFYHFIDFRVGMEIGVISCHRCKHGPLANVSIQFPATPFVLLFPDHPGPIVKPIASLHYNIILHQTFHPMFPSRAFYFEPCPFHLFFYFLLCIHLNPNPLTIATIFIF